MFLAVDHRDAMRVLTSGEHPEAIQAAQLTGGFGFLVGRALTREPVHLQGRNRDLFLNGEAPRRWQELRAVAEAHAHPGLHATG
jgi:hypothetical protein